MSSRSRQTLRFQAYNLLMLALRRPVVDGACAPANKVLSPSHETIASLENGPAADDDTAAATGHPAPPVIHSGSSARDPGGAGIQPYAGTPGRRRRFRQRRSDGGQHR